MVLDGEGAALDGEGARGEKLCWQCLLYNNSVSCMFLICALHVCFISQ